MKRPGFPAFWRAFWSGKQQPSIPVAPKARRSGPYTVTLGPRCAQCREPVLAGEATLIEPRGLCGRCAAHAQGGAMPDSAA